MDETLDPYQFANAICNLVTVDIKWVCLTFDEIDCVCQRIANCPNLKIQYLNLEGTNLDGLSPGVLMNAIQRIPITKISGWSVHSEQLDEMVNILEKSAGETKLQKLVIRVPAGVSRIYWRSRFRRVQAKIELVF